MSCEIGPRAEANNAIPCNTVRYKYNCYDRIEPGPAETEKVVVARTWCMFSFGPKTRISAQKLVFALCLQITFSTFRFRATDVFVKKNLADVPKSLPPPHWGALSASPSVLKRSARAGKLS